MENGSINIEEIMAEIKQKIKEQGLTADMLSFEDVPYKKNAQSGPRLRFIKLLHRSLPKKTTSCWWTRLKRARLSCG